MWFFFPHLWDFGHLKKGSTFNLFASWFHMEISAGPCPSLASGWRASSWKWARVIFWGGLLPLWQDVWLHLQQAQPCGFDVLSHVMCTVPAIRAFPICSWPSPSRAMVTLEATQRILRLPKSWFSMSSLGAWNDLLDPGSFWPFGMVGDHQSGAVPGCTGRGCWCQHPETAMTQGKPRPQKRCTPEVWTKRIQKGVVVSCRFFLFFCLGIWRIIPKMLEHYIVKICQNCSKKHTWEWIDCLTISLAMLRQPRKSAQPRRSVKPKRRAEALFFGCQKWNGEWWRIPFGPQKVSTKCYNQWLKLMLSVNVGELIQNGYCTFVGSSRPWPRATCPCQSLLRWYPSVSKIFQFSHVFFDLKFWFNPKWKHWNINWKLIFHLMFPEDDGSSNRSGASGGWQRHGVLLPSSQPWHCLRPLQGIPADPLEQVE